MGILEKSNKSASSRVRVAIYARVSTEHEAQIYALDNQVDWYDDVLKRHPNWDLIEKYVDRGITGTSAKKRPGFLRMMEDAATGAFDLIVTREVSRFARNTVDTLSYTRNLRRQGVEVYFVEDNIWTFDPDGELRLTIMATLAQDESRKISIRTRAGQQTSMEKGVFFQNGSVLGYDFDKDRRTLVVNAEQAETVRMIFRLYIAGMGVRKIQWELEKAGRKTAKGGTLWSASVICRILKNKLYCGVIVWHKQFVEDFLLQHKVNNHGDGPEQFEVIGSHEPIITLEEWQEANNRLSSMHSQNGAQTAKKPPGDVWTRKLRCVCGQSFNKRRWRKDPATGRIYYGYTCYAVVKSGSVEARKKKGLPVDGLCDTPSIARWKLELMALYIFRQLPLNREGILQMGFAVLDAGASKGSDDSVTKQLTALREEREKLAKRIAGLVEMRADGEITKTEFLEQKLRCESRITEIDVEKRAIDPETVAVDNERRLEAWRACLDQMLDFKDAESIPEYTIDAMVEYILVEGRTFRWKLRFLPEEQVLCVDGGRKTNANIIASKSIKKNNTFAQCSAGSHSPKQELKKPPFAAFTVTKADAVELVKKSPRERVHRWDDIHVEIYI